MLWINLPAKSLGEESRLVVELDGSHLVTGEERRIGHAKAVSGERDIVRVVDGSANHTSRKLVQIPKRNECATHNVRSTNPRSSANIACNNIAIDVNL